LWTGGNRRAATHIVGVLVPGKDNLSRGSTITLLLETTMAKEIRCADVGMDCDFVTRAESEEELLQKVVEHAQDVHGITEITPELHQKVTEVIREV
jgi:predicted small metal-binding protein